MSAQHLIMPTPSAPARPAVMHALPALAATVRPIAIAPTFNHVATLIGVLTRVEAAGVPIVAVNDGSTDGTAAALAAWMSRPHDVAVHLVTHPRNRGKAQALRSGFDEAARLGFTHALTIDTDGQHDPSDIPALLRTAESNPDDLVLGERSDKLAHYPRSSMIGRRLTNLAIRLACGVRVGDSQCGMRVYPLRMVQSVPCRGQRYAFESEIITRAAWGGWGIRRVPVSSWYPPPGSHISHFRGFKDSMQWVRLQCRLLSRALWPWKPKSR
jgi:hypothetical protein